MLRGVLHSRRTISAKKADDYWWVSLAAARSPPLTLSMEISTGCCGEDSDNHSRSKACGQSGLAMAPAPDQRTHCSLLRAPMMKRMACSAQSHPGTTARTI